VNKRIERGIRYSSLFGFLLKGAKSMKMEKTSSTRFKFVKGLKGKGGIKG